jgi:hypothetical protein
VLPLQALALRHWHRNLDRFRADCPRLVVALVVLPNYPELRFDFRSVRLVPSHLRFRPMLSLHRRAVRLLQLLVHPMDYCPVLLRQMPPERVREPRSQV